MFPILVTVLFVFNHMLGMNLLLILGFMLQEPDYLCQDSKEDATLKECSLKQACEAKNNGWLYQADTSKENYIYNWFTEADYVCYTPQ